MSWPAYLELSQSGELARRAGMAYAAMRKCMLCPRNCGVNRLNNISVRPERIARSSSTSSERTGDESKGSDKKGFCRTGKICKVASANLHFGEEPPISGTNGSGTIFFSNCNLRCAFCQNYPISQLGNGEYTTPHELAEMMLHLQERGAHNINLVTPSHVVPQFLAGLAIATRNYFKTPSETVSQLEESAVRPEPVEGRTLKIKGFSVRGSTSSPRTGNCDTVSSKEGDSLEIPIVYNCSGYDGIEALKLLDGVVDIYMPDIKYCEHEVAERYSGATKYWDAVRPAVKEMYRQVGPLVMDERGIGVRGLLVRHLVLPGGLASSEKIFEFIATELSKDVPVNLMSQYFPAHKAVDDPVLGRRITREEFRQAEDALHRWGLTEGWIQDM